MIHADVVAQAQGAPPKSFAANGGSNAAPSLTTWKKLVIHRSASIEGSVEGENRCAPPTPLHGSTRNSAAGPKPGPLCRDRAHAALGAAAIRPGAQGGWLGKSVPVNSGLEPCLGRLIE